MKKMTKWLKTTSFAAFAVGFLFAIGLGISGMTQPQKVIGFLDLFGGAWDPSLAFVMMGALAVHTITYRLVRRRQTPLLETRWHVPTKKEITPALVLGSVIFGVGWAIGGYCPGPALTTLGTGSSKALVFVIAMFAGMYLFRTLDRFVQFRK